MRFPLGRLVATPGALNVLRVHRMNPSELLSRHANGDWGDLDRFDRQQNEDALTHGGRLLSAYTVPGTDVKLWVITEADRSVTTILLPSEY